MPRDKSTTVRSVGTGALRLGLAVGGAIAPALAARAAERMFLTPPRHPPPPREGELLAGAEPFAVRAGAEILRCWRFGEGPPVLLVHGWGGRGGQMAPLAPALRAAGRAAVTFDGPAHGASSGRTASVPAFADAVAAVAAHVGARAAVGHSMGAAGLALAMIRGLELDAAAFLAPPRSPAAFLARFFDALRLSAPVREGVRARLERRLRIGVDALDLPRMAGGMEVPLLVVHDRGDGEVPWADGAAIAAAWPGARLVTTDGLGHRRIIRDPDVAAEVAAFVSRPAEARESPAAAG
ncbi:MAG TPA: alpha/beta fold hydrolase [Anaeromyxobacteraceae bacterium]